MIAQDQQPSNTILVEQEEATAKKSRQRIFSTCFLVEEGLEDVSQHSLSVFLHFIASKDGRGVLFVGGGVCELDLESY